MSISPPFSYRSRPRSVHDHSDMPPHLASQLTPINQFRRYKVQIKALRTMFRAATHRKGQSALKLDGPLALSGCLARSWNSPLLAPSACMSLCLNQSASASTLELHATARSFRPLPAPACAVALACAKAPLPSLEEACESAMAVEDPPRHLWMSPDDAAAAEKALAAPLPLAWASEDASA